MEQRSHSKSHPIHASVRRDIHWWSSFIVRWNGTSLLLEEQWSAAGADMQLYTDACQQGYGAVYGRQWIAGRWSPHQLRVARKRGRKLSMPYLELLALTLAVATWGHQWRGKKVTLRTDCLGVMYQLNDLTSRVPRSMLLLRPVSTVAARCEFDFRAAHIAGVRNVAADALSRDDMVTFRQNQPDADAHATTVVAVPLLEAEVGEM